MGWLNGLVQGCLVAAGVACLVRVLRVNAATRYWLWLAALAAIMALQVGGGRSAPSPAVREEPVLTVAVPEPSGEWMLLLPAAWALVALAMLVRLGRSYRSAARLRDLAEPADADLTRRLEHWRQASGATRPVRLCISDGVRAPLSFGLSDPVIVLPAAHLEELTGTELDQAILHELAHVERRDDWTKLLQRLAEAFLLFHPAVWWVGRRLNLEREFACDDWVVAVSGERRSYASCLARLAEIAGQPRGVELALGSGFTTKQLSRRIEMLLDTGRTWSRRVSGPWLAAGLGVLAVGAVLAANLAPLVAAPSPQADVRAAQERQEKEVEKRLEFELRRLQEHLTERFRAMESRLSDLEQRIARQKEERIRELHEDAEVKALRERLAAIEAAKMRAIEPKMRELGRQMEKIREEALRDLEPQMRELERKIRELKLRRDSDI